MKSFHIKSIILGTGIGVILTSILFMIYNLGASQKMSKEEIIQKAKTYGMVENNGMVKTGDFKIDGNNVEQKNNDTTKTTTSNPVKTESNLVPPTPVPIITPVPKQEALDDIYVVIISRGDTSEIVAKKLFEKGVIDNKDAFVKDVMNMGLSDEINVGDFKLKKGMDNKTIIKIITKIS